MQRENKWQDKFDEKFRHRLDIMTPPDKYGDRVEVNGEFEHIKSFIQSELDTAIAEERERIVKEIYSEEWFELNSDADYIVNEIINKDK